MHLNFFSCIIMYMYFCKLFKMFYLLKGLHYFFFLFIIVDQKQPTDLAKGNEMYVCILSIV